jgi:hypothetical protein
MCENKQMFLCLGVRGGLSGTIALGLIFPIAHGLNHGLWEKIVFKMEFLFQQKHFYP